jgi:hypothetical protein
MEQRCKTCRHWEPWRPADTHGECKAITLHTDQGAAFLSDDGQSEEPPTLDTFEAFGCVLWTAKPEPVGT